MMIEARGLARTFRNRGRGKTIEAVRGIDLEVDGGEIVGLLGPNGAGKTTTQRMLATLLEPTAGEATVAGCDLSTGMLAQAAARSRRVGWMRGDSARQ